MDQISAIAASGLRARLQSLDLLANNMANASTNGYKGDGEFYSLFTSDAAEPDANGDVARSPMIERQWTDFAQGLIQQTNNPLDVALSGKGFFTVKTPSGNLYTRNGSFHLATDGTISTEDGYPVLNTDGEPVKVDPKQKIDISPDGVVHQKGQELGKLQVVQFKDTTTLLKQGNTNFKNESDQKPAAAANVQVQQGKIETSNVNAAHGAVRLVGVMRQFELMQKAISISNDMGKKAIEEVAKI